MNRILAQLSLDPLRLSALVLVFSGMASAVNQSSAGEDSTHRWFGYGMAWYEHPCSRSNLAVFGVYGQLDIPENRLNYEITKRDPSRCASLFPLPLVQPLSYRGQTRDVAITQP